MPTLLSNATATGSAAAWGGGQGVFAAVGTFSGATVSLQFLGPDGSTWVAAGSATTLTAAGAGVFVLPPGQIRAAISGGPPTGMYAQAEQAK
jgi:hypothetical protein